MWNKCSKCGKLDWLCWCYTDFKILSVITVVIIMLTVIIILEILASTQSPIDFSFLCFSLFLSFSFHFHFSMLTPLSSDLGSHFLWFPCWLVCPALYCHWVSIMDCCRRFEWVATLCWFPALWWFYFVGGPVAWTLVLFGRVTFQWVSGSRWAALWWVGLHALWQGWWWCALWQDG